MMLYTQFRRYLTLVALVGILCVRAIAQQAPPATDTGNKPIVLDRVIAIVNGEVVLESDIREEIRMAVLQPISIPTDQNSDVRAARRIISRALILRQMKDQQQIKYEVTDDEVRKSLTDLRMQLPVCRQLHCETDEGWQAFLQEHGLTEEEVYDHWRQRLEILKFIDVRFGTSIRISRQDIQKYYGDAIIPAFEKQKQKPPTLESVSARIREILLQQQVNSMLRDWLQSLREQGSVQILDSRYGQSTNSSDDDDGGGA